MSQAICRFAFRGGDAEPAERARDRIAGVVGDQQERGLPVGVMNRNRRRLVRRQ